MWNARQAKRHRLATDQQHPLVALGNAGQKLLHHHGLLTVAVQGFDDGAQVQTISANLENAHAAHAIERLQNDGAVCCMKGANIGLIARDQRGCNELRKLQNGQLFRVVAQCRWAVEHLGAFAFSLAQ